MYLCWVEVEFVRGVSLADLCSYGTEAAGEYLAEIADVSGGCVQFGTAESGRPF
jgi:hypothetical protein